MQKLRQYKKTRNKNRNHQSTFDSPQGEGEFMNESNDSMLTVSDSLGNMNTGDALVEEDIDQTLLDEFAGDSELSAENDYPAGNSNRVGASAKRSASTQTTARSASTSTDAYASESSSAADSDSASSSESTSDSSVESESTTKSRSKKNSKFELQPKQIPVLLKDKVNDATARAQELLYPYAKDVNLKVQGYYKEAKVQGAKINTQIKKQPYFFALGAVVAGFTLAKLLTSDSPKYKS